MVDTNIPVVAKRKVNWTKVLLVVLIVMSSVFIIGPGLMGYGVYLQIKDSNYTVSELGKNINSLEQKLEVTQQNLSLQNAFNSNVMGLIQKNNDDLISCKTDKSKLEAENKYAADLCDEKIKGFQQELDATKTKQAEQANAEATATQQAATQCTIDLSKTLQQLVDTQQQLDGLVQNMARNICCKQKVDNSNIKGYSVVSNKLVCLEEGGTALNCALS